MAMVLIFFVPYRNTDGSDISTLPRLSGENIHKYVIYLTIKMKYQIIYNYSMRKLKNYSIFKNTLISNFKLPIYLLI